jgi:hypothetical protein
MRDTDVVRSAAFFARSNMQLPGQRRVTAERQKFLEGRLHYGRQWRRSLLPAQPRIQLGFDFIAGGDAGTRPVCFRPALSLSQKLANRASTR